MTPPALSAISKHLTVPTRLDEICLKAMQKEPRGRYSNIMMDMVREIRQFREQTMLGPTGS